MRELWIEIYQTIKRNKWRSIMTAFGIFWGMLMLILLVGIGMGFNNGIIATLKTLPTNSVFYFAGKTSMPYQGYAKGRYWYLKNRDMDILQARFGNIIKRIVPCNQDGEKRCSFGEYSGEFAVLGTTYGYYYSVPQQLIYGRYINEIDQKEHRKVCVIGKKVYETLFKHGGDPCGEIVKVGDIYYTIVGVAKETSGMINLGSSLNESVVIPISTAQATYGEGDIIYILIVTLRDDCPAEEWQDKIDAVLKEVHYIHPDDKQALDSLNLAELIKNFDYLFLGIYILIWIIGAGTLLAGIIGVSNIMLVTVKERTQEIGIRRAIGASPFTILSQIMSESIVITVVSGIVGLVLGVWILRVVDLITSRNMTGEVGGGGVEIQAFSNPQIPFSIAIAAFLILLIGGFLAGLMPAKRAMDIKAIDALRDE